MIHQGAACAAQAFDEVGEMEFKDYYQVLGVEPSADEKAIKAAYRRLARKYHPDVSREAGAEEKFKAVNEANEVLSDPAKRTQYDRVRAGGYRAGDRWDGGGGFGGAGPRFEDVDFGGGGGFSDFFESLFGARARNAQRAGPRAPTEVRTKLEVDLETIHTGGSCRIEVAGKTLDVKIPAGIEEGKVIRLAGQGGAGRDLLLEIAYRKHPRFEVQGRDVILRQPISPWDAALGTKMEVVTLGGNVALTIPAGSDTGRRLRLRGRGLPQGSSHGDQFVVLEVSTPAPANEQQRAAYEALKKAFG